MAKDAKKGRGNKRGAPGRLRFRSPAAPFVYLLLVSAAATAALISLTPDFMSEQLAHLRQNPIVILLEFVPVALLVGLLYFASGHAWVAASAASLIVFAAGGVNRYKVFLRGDPLMPSDLMLGGEALSISQSSTIKLGAGVVALFALVVAANVAAAVLLRFERRPRALSRVAGAAACAALMALSFVAVYSSDGVYDSIPIKHNQYNMVNEFNSKGFLLAFFHHVKDMYLTKPDGYTERRALDILAAYGGAAAGGNAAADAGDDDDGADAEAEAEAGAAGDAAEAGAAAAAGGGFRPDVIFLMSEAFWDITQIPALVFDEDPIPEFHRLVGEGATGELYTSVYGGGTDATEFNVLTGHSSVNYSPNISSAFKFLVRRDTDSIARTFKGAGYAAIGLHPGYKWFYNRENVYRWLGFDRFIDIEAFDEAKDVSGNYISDEAMTDMLLATYDAHVGGGGDAGAVAGAGGGPLFMFVVSIQNHGPYDAGYMYGSDMPPNYALADGAAPLDEKSHYALTNYIRGIEDADRELGRLVRRLEGSARPAVLVFFGDHLPGLCYNFGAYKALGYPIGADDGLEGLANEYRVRYVIWANAAARAVWPEYAGMSAGPRRMSANYLGAYLLGKLGLPTTPYEGLLLGLQERAPVLHPMFFGTDAADGAPLSERPPASLAADLDGYRIAQYYKLHDEKLD